MSAMCWHGDVVDRFPPEALFILWKAVMQQEGRGGRDAETEEDGFVGSGPSKCHQLLSLHLSLCSYLLALSHSQVFFSFLSEQ